MFYRRKTQLVLYSRRTVSFEYFMTAFSSYAFCLLQSMHELRFIFRAVLRYAYYFYGYP